MDKKTSSRIGGQQTLERYGRDHFSSVGKLGGRPRVMTKSLPALEIEGPIKGNSGLPNSLAELKRLMRNKQQGVLGQ